MRLENGVFKDLNIQGVKFVVDLIPEGRLRRPGIKMSPQYVTIHNTGLDGVKADNFRRAQLDKSQDCEVSWHFTVDESTIIQHIPITEVGWHAGTEKGNYSSFAIETCERTGAEEVVIKFVAQILEYMNWTTNNVRTHKSWSGKQCPWKILPHWDQFIANIKSEMGEDRDLIEAANELGELGILKTPEAWYDEDKMNMKYVPMLLENAGGVDKLIADGVIIEPQIWKGGTYRANHVVCLIKKLAEVYSVYDEWTGKVTATTLNVRTGPGTNYPNLSSKPTVTSGTKLQIVGEKKAVDGSLWYKVKISNATGYVSASYVTKA